MSLRELLTDRTSRSRRHAVLGGYVLAITIILFVGCQTYYQSPIDDALLNNSQNCTCNGSTLECTAADGGVVSEANSNWCSQQFLNDAGMCSCSGTTLNCSVQICMAAVDNFAYFCPVNNEEHAAVICDDGASFEAGYPAIVNPTANSLSLAFASSDQCTDANGFIPPPPQATSVPSGGSQSTSVPSGGQTDVCANNGGLSYAGDTCVCPGVVDHVVICGDGTKFDNVTNQSCVPTESCSGGGAEPEVVCGCGQYGAPPFGLGCSNGVIEECNVSCGCKP